MPLFFCLQCQPFPLSIALRDSGIAAQGRRCREWSIGSAGVDKGWSTSPQRSRGFATSHGFTCPPPVPGDKRSTVADADLILVMTQSQKESIECDFPSARGKTSLLSEVAKGEVYDIPDPVLQLMRSTSIAEEI